MGDMELMEVITGSSETPGEPRGEKMDTYWRREATLAVSLNQPHIQKCLSRQPDGFLSSSNGKLTLDEPLGFSNTFGKSIRVHISINYIFFENIKADFSANVFEHGWIVLRLLVQEF